MALGNTATVKGGVHVHGGRIGSNGGDTNVYLSVLIEEGNGCDGGHDDSNDGGEDNVQITKVILGEAIQYQRLKGTV